MNAVAARASPARSPWHQRCKARLATLPAVSRELLLWIGPFSALGIFAFHPALLVVGWRVYVIRAELAAELDRALPANARWWHALPALIVLLTAALLQGSHPADDLNRHLTAYRHGYDYHRIYPDFDARAPHVSMWFGFEWLVGWLHRALGLAWSAALVQLLALLAMLVAMQGALRRALADHPACALLAFCGTCLALQAVVLGRVQLSRPEIFFSAWALSALWLRPGAWLAIGVLMQPLYWLAPVYAVAALLLNTSWRTRIICATLVVLAAALFWLSYAGVEWPRYYALSIDWLRNRADGMGVSENATLLRIFNRPSCVVLVLFLVLYPHDNGPSPRNWPMALVLGAFLLPDQVRYASVVVPLLLVWAASRLPRKLGALAQPWVRVLLASLATWSLLASSSWPAPPRDLPSFASLTGKEYLLTPFGPSTFILPAQHPGLRVAPSLDFGGVPLSLQNLSGKLSHGVVDCEGLRAHSRLTHVVLQRLDHAPQCVTLQEASKGWMLWRINSHAHP